MTGNRYTKVAITLHWLIALSIIGLLVVGLLMTQRDLLPQAVQFKAYQLHKSFGLSVLVLSVIRLGWRLGHKPPALPPDMPAWEVFAAKATHWAFYFLMFALPLSGWALVSTSSFSFPTMWFGLFEWPHLPIGTEDTKEQINSIASGSHEIMAYLMIVLLGGHVGAALKHHFWNRDDVLTHMVPILKPLKKKTA